MNNRHKTQNKIAAYKTKMDLEIRFSIHNVVILCSCMKFTKKVFAYIYVPIEGFARSWFRDDVDDFLTHSCCVLC